MKKITKKSMTRNKIVLGGDYKNLLEDIASSICMHPALIYTDIKTAVELYMLDFEVENASFQDDLKPFYNENYDLIPLIGIDGLMNLALQDKLTQQVTETNMLDLIGKAIAFDFAAFSMVDGKTYSQDLITFINDIIPTAYTDIAEMLEDIIIGLEITEVIEKPKKSKCAGCKNCSCGKKKKTTPTPQIRVIVSDDASLDNDILALLKMLNGGN